MFRITENKLINSGLADKDAPLMGCLDARLEWNRTHRKIAELEIIFKQLNIQALIFSQPAEPYRSIIDYLAQTSNGTITPNDCETRMFLHDLPVAFELSPDAVVPLLKTRKCVIIPGQGIIAYGMVGLEQAYVIFSSVCFAGFVKFFVDFLFHTKRDQVDKKRRKAFEHAIQHLDPPVFFNGSLTKGPFKSKNDIYQAIQEAGRRIVEKRLVDSCFGNISFCHGQNLYISQTGSNLDQLKGAIDPCPLDSASRAPATASSELPTHLEIVRLTDNRAILHGHPKFSVILSMDCDVEDCICRGRCHVKCPHERFACGGIPIVSGEVGAGPSALCHTVPQAIRDHQGAIVYGHGVFTAGKDDFNQPFKHLIHIENNCRTEYFNRIRSYL